MKQQRDRAEFSETRLTPVWVLPHKRINIDNEDKQLRGCFARSLADKGKAQTESSHEKINLRPSFSSDRVKNTGDRVILEHLYEGVVSLERSSADMSLRP